MPVWLRILVGLLAGALAGPLLGERAVLLEPVGDLFLTAIRMLVMPLIFVSLVGGIASVGSLSRMGRIGGKTFGLYLLTTAAAIPLGIALGLLLEPGSGLRLALPDNAAIAPIGNQNWFAILPENPVRAFAEGNTLQVIVFSVLVGIAVIAAGESAQPFRQVVDSAAAVIFKLTELVIATAPIGVFALIAVVTARHGLASLLPLGKLILALYLGCLLHAAFTLAALVRFGTGLSPLQFFRGIFEAQMVGFSTTSAAGTLPVTLACAEHNLGISRDIAGFVLPVGATINMDGTAIYQALVALFVAQVYGIDLAFVDYITLLLVTVMASIGTASVPAAGLVAMSIVLSALGLPLEGIALVAGIDRILDMARTTLNITGDAAVALVVASTESALDRDIFYREPE